MKTLRAPFFVFGAFLAAGAACSSTNVFYATDAGTDGGSSEEATVDAGQSDVKTTKTDSGKADTGKAQQEFTADCQGYCAKAAEQIPTCDEGKCEDACASAQADAAACPSAWQAFLDCAVSSKATVSGCTSAGKVAFSGCSTAQNALEACVSGPHNQCIANCTTNPQCEASCPVATAGHATCCDVSSGVCYQTASGSSCPAPDDGGTPPPQY